RPPPRSTLSPYTTLFRSRAALATPVLVRRRSPVRGIRMHPPAIDHDPLGTATITPRRLLDTGVSRRRGGPPPTSQDLPERLGAEPDRAGDPVLVPAAGVQRESRGRFLPVPQGDVLAGVAAQERHQVRGAVPGTDSQIGEHHAALTFRAYRLSRSRLHVRHCRCPSLGWKNVVSGVHSWPLMQCVSRGNWWVRSGCFLRHRSQVRQTRYPLGRV